MGVRNRLASKPRQRDIHFRLMSDNDKPGNGGDRPPKQALTLEQAREQLHPFLEANPSSAVEEIDSEDGKRLGIKNPWGEDALVIYLPPDLAPLAEALNNVLLPNRFTAVWHRDTSDFEVIWTAFPIRGPWKEVGERAFRFHYDSKEYRCEFGRSSDRLLQIAEHAAPVAISHTGHRNLMSFNAYIQYQKAKNDKERPRPPIGEPRSFWIRNLEWDENVVERIAHHLSFYLTYYDHKSPHIFVHTPPTEEVVPRTRYLIGAFPERLDAQEIEDDLLHLWLAFREGDAGRRFVYCYRIIEYASHAYIDRAARKQVRMLLTAPHALSDIGDLAEQVIAAALSSKGDDVQRVSMLLRDAVNPDLLWREISLNRQVFSEEIRFDGGFELKPLLSADMTQATFATTGLDTFANAARQIRNHLSHGRDRTTQTSITPTVANFRRLEPWVSVISVAAGEVINFKHIA